tara:strand:- start:11 stop:634 length:624 start_codon:yes stop_codon:yes gene_type:complete
MIDNDTQLLEEAYDVIFEGILQEGVFDHIENLNDKITMLPQFIDSSLSWLGKAAIGGLAGVVVVNGLGKIFQIIAKRLDRARVKIGDNEQAAVAGVADSEYNKKRDEYEQDTNEEMPLEQQVELRNDIAEKLQEMYPIRDKTFWVKALETSAEGLQSKVGIGIGAILGVMALNLAIPFSDVVAKSFGLGQIGGGTDVADIFITKPGN